MLGCEISFYAQQLTVRFQSNISSTKYFREVIFHAAT